MHVKTSGFQSGLSPHSADDGVLDFHAIPYIIPFNRSNRDYEQTKNKVNDVIINANILGGDEFDSHQSRERGVYTAFH